MAETFEDMARRKGLLCKSTGVNRAALPGMEPSEPGRVVELDLPLAPSINHYWRHRIATPRNGQPFIAVYISGEGEAFKEAVALALMGVKPMTGPLSLSIIVCPKDARPIDVDNRIKTTADALAAAGLVRNDSQFEEVHAVLGPIHRPGGRVLVRVAPLAA